ncbi:MAG: efflux RND transporter permease subunit, partial [Proteobacteria bacterium]|nr:efflux RND transporter permease subunit [Pseudomonadota bacterium]
PIQLLPETSNPVISVNNNWREAAPAEMESYIIEPQEAVLQAVPGVTEINSTIGRGFGSINLEFEIGTDMQQALINVINRLNQAPPLPADANEPFVFSGAGGNNGQMVASLQVRPLPGNPNQDLYDPAYQATLENIMQPRLMRIPGVSNVQLNSLRARQVQITFDPYRAAALGIPINNIANALRGSTDMSGGFANVGRRQYTVRYTGQYEIEKLGELIVAWNGDRPVQLNEVADIELGLADPFGVNIRNGYPAFYVQVQRNNDSNTVAILDELNIALAELNAGALKEVGLTVDLSFDSSVYIRRAINLVQGNLLLGVVLSIGILWFFLRDRRSTLIIAASIPVSLLFAFVALDLFNLSLNVISLAGLAFAVGLVLDASIIVQENIVRYRQQGESLDKAVLHGADQVKGALFASTMTTIAIFLPILFLEGLEGQLFKDLALTLSVAVFASMLAALTVIPIASKLWLKSVKKDDPHAHWWESVTKVVLRLTDRASWRWGWLFGLIVLPLALAIALKPNADFLPSAKADAVTVFFNMPPGVNNELFEKEIAAEVVRRLKPYMDHEKAPYIRGYNLSMFGTFNILFLYPQNPDETEEWLELVRGPLLKGIPDVQAFGNRASLLGIGFDGGRSISVDLQGADITGLMTAAGQGMGIINELIPGAVVRPVPGLSLAEPELQIVPRERRITEAGLNPQDVASAVRAMTGGLFVNEYFDGNERYDVILRTGRWSNPEQLAAMPVATPLAGAQTIGELAEIRRTVGPTQLRRIDGQRTISLVVTPPDHMTVEEALDTLRDEAGPKIQAALPSGASIAYRGSADELEEALFGMLKNFLLAMLILFMVMAAIFKSMRDSLLVLLVMPLALSGGLIALRLLNLVTYQSLDMLTMIGFIILLGLVVNNAILLVSQTRDGQREGMSLRDAVESAVRVRARPVYMSTLTSLFGMLPLMLVPGTGSDIYRGLATVIVGGMFCSAAFTLVLMPALLRLNEDSRLFATLRERLANRKFAEGIEQ